MGRPTDSTVYNPALPAPAPERTGPEQYGRKEPKAKAKLPKTETQAFQGEGNRGAGARERTRTRKWRSESERGNAHWLTSVFFFTAFHCCCESLRVGFRVGDRSRGRFATPAGFPRQDCSRYRGLHVRRERLGFVARSRTILCRPVPNPSVTIRNFFIAVHRGARRELLRNHRRGVQC
jgi:hypothetical protein